MSVSSHDRTGVEYSRTSAAGGIGDVEYADNRNTHTDDVVDGWCWRKVRFVGLHSSLDNLWNFYELRAEKEVVEIHGFVGK